MNSFQILDKEGNAIPLEILDADAAKLWGKEIDKKRYAYPEQLKSVEEGTTKERIQTKMHNALISSFNWFDQIGWYIAYQGSTYSLNTWKNVVHTMVAEYLGSELLNLKDNNHMAFQEFTFDDTPHLNQETEFRICYYMKNFQPMLDLINLWISKGYTPKQVKE